MGQQFAFVALFMLGMICVHGVAINDPFEIAFGEELASNLTLELKARALESEVSDLKWIVKPYHYSIGRRQHSKSYQYWL